MDVVKLIKMSRKSIYPFGIMKDVSVQQLLDLKKMSYIAYSYYNYSKITYADDILTEIGIIDDLLIEKPGKNPDMKQVWQKRFYQNLTDQERIVINGKLKRRKKYMYEKGNHRANRLSKGTMQAFNHNKKKPTHSF